MAALLLVSVFGLHAEEYLSSEQFLASAFGTDKPAMKTFWFSDELRDQARQSVGWAPAALRVRYWGHQTRRAWILEQIGKEKPITLGVVVEQGVITQVRVLAFRESRGWEIRHAFFTDQYAGVRLAENGELSSSVDGITGATLSVRAVNRVARMALWLDAQVSHDAPRQ